MESKEGVIFSVNSSYFPRIPNPPQIPLTEETTKEKIHQIHTSPQICDSPEQESRIHTGYFIL